MKDCPWCHIDPNEIAALKQRVAELERGLEAARKEANVAAKKIVAALDKRWPNLNIEGWDNEEAAGIVAAALAAYRATKERSAS